MISDPEQELVDFFKNMDLDLRKSEFSRFMDQKVTPDVLCFISDCVLNLPNTQSFTTSDIWNSYYFERNVTAIFGKPSPKNENASSEYDKFIIQPLRVLYYSEVLESERKGHGYSYSIKNHEILEFISIKERNSYIFLYQYLMKVLSDSGLLTFFEKFRQKCEIGDVSNEDYTELRNRFIMFMRGHTPINQDVEIRRIFPKILNIYAYAHMINGSEKGSLSKYPFQWSDLMYNRLNWRDTSKSKAITRREAESYRDRGPSDDYFAYLINKAKALINKKYGGSEVRDKYAVGPASHVHHIFPVSTFRELATYLENLIKLTPTQHLSMAHPNGNTHLINQDYQSVCLLAKSMSIEESLKNGEMFYSVPNFVHVINTGLGLSLSTGTDFNSIRRAINNYYNRI
jgi:hypothetical protein